jgi:hypothetical protein
MSSIRTRKGVTACCTGVQHNVRADVTAEASTAGGAAAPKTGKDVVALGYESARVEEDEVRVEVGAREGMAAVVPFASDHV